MFSFSKFALDGVKRFAFFEVVPFRPGLFPPRYGRFPPATCTRLCVVRFRCPAFDGVAPLNRLFVKRARLLRKAGRLPLFRNGYYVAVWLLVNREGSPSICLSPSGRRPKGIDVPLPLRV